MDIKLKGQYGMTSVDLTLTVPPEVADIVKGLSDLAKQASAQLKEEREAKAERLR